MRERVGGSSSLRGAEEQPSGHEPVEWLQTTAVLVDPEPAAGARPSAPETAEAERRSGSGSGAGGAGGGAWVGEADSGGAGGRVEGGEGSGGAASAQLGAARTAPAAPLASDRPYFVAIAPQYP